MGIQTLYASYFVNVMLRCVFGHKWTDLPNRMHTCLVVRSRANYVFRSSQVSRYHIGKVGFLPYSMASPVPVRICPPEQNVKSVHGEVGYCTNWNDCDNDMGNRKHTLGLI